MTRLCTSYIYSCFRYTHGVLHDAVFDNESGEGWKQAADSLNLPYLEVIQIASHDVINPRMASLKFMNLWQFWLGRMINRLA